MKTINVTFEDKEYKGLLKRKKNKSWHDFIIKNGTETNGNGLGGK